jgi:hypothetical protein
MEWESAVRERKLAVKAQIHADETFREGKIVPRVQTNEIVTCMRGKYGGLTRAFVSNQTFSSMLTITLFFIFLALSAYRNVETVSSTFVSAGLIQAIINVYEFPPRES